ncbi:MAG: hypothetical protein HC902_00270 [Calothrix sp. SM1_5_4]|nr:hypothetical protein [Calothrix sp. SM1_5_4]
MQLFKQEEELVNAFTLRSNAFLSGLLRKSDFCSFLIHEFNSYFGIADVVLGTLNLSASNSKRGPVNPNWVGPLATLKKGQVFTVDGFGKSFRVSGTSARNYLKNYEDAGFLVRTERASFKVIKEYRPVTSFVVSIEAKLKNWQRALEQAQRYKKFSDLSFVLLDGSHAEVAIKNIDKFREKNIGLICLSEAKMETHFVPSKNDKKVSEYCFRVSEMAYGSYSAMSSTC